MSSGRLRGGQREARLTSGTAQIDTFEDGGHLGGSDLDAAILGLGEAKGTFLKAFVPECEAVAVPVEDLDPVASLVAKDVEVPREGVLGDPIANELGEAVEALSHVGGLDGQEDAKRRRQAQHVGDSRAAPPRLSV